MPRSKTGISSPSSDSAASAAASSASPLSTATAKDVIAVSVFAPGPWLRGPGAPGLELAERRRIGDAEEHADDPDRPQREVEVDLIGGQLGARGVDDVHRLRRVLHEQQRAREHHRRQPAGDRIGQRRVALPQRLGGRRAAHELGRRAQLERQRVAQLRRGRLGLRALQVRERRLGRAALDRDRRRLAQPLDHPRVAARRRRHQLRRDPLRRGAELEQQPRRARVLEPAPRRRQLAVDRVAHQRVHERLVRAQDLGPHERVDRLRRLVLGHLGQRGDRRQPRLLAQHRDRARDHAPPARGAARAAAAPSATPPAGRSRAPRRRARRRARPSRPRARSAAGAAAAGCRP